AMKNGITIIFFFIISNILTIFGVWGYKEPVPSYLLIIALWGMWVVWILTFTICANKKNSKLPKVKKIVYKTGKVTFIVDNSNDLFGFESLASIYYYDNNDKIEILIGIGYVETINNKGYLQIVIVNWIFNETVCEIKEKLINKSAHCNDIMIKPSIPKICLEGTIKNENE
ncbi:MAG: hypothetical protein FWC09_07585, partial [Lachnospiraceae bacterium]|nr:hypothetical protein [Lachnospiraceae bacterium]